MEDLLLLLLELFGEFLLEVILQLFAEGIIDVGARVLARLARGLEFASSVTASLVYVFFGLAAGGLSLLAFPHPFLRPSGFRGISLLVAPFITGWVMSVIGDRLREREKKVVRIESFGCGFTFAFGMALVRFLFAKPA